MDRTFAGRQRYWEASRRVRETFCRYTLGDLLSMVFDVTEIPGGPRPPVAELEDDEFEHVVRILQEYVADTEPAWEQGMDESRRLPLAEDARAQVAEAFERIRAIAHDVAAGEATDEVRVTVGISLPARIYQDRAGRPRWVFHGRLADALVWMALSLFSEVPRSLIRRCTFEGCSRIYVASKNQRYCLHHQVLARRQTQRQAERAFRARQRAKTKRRKR